MVENLVRSVQDGMGMMSVGTLLLSREGGRGRKIKIGVVMKRIGQVRGVGRKIPRWVRREVRRGLYS
jgi:hypothetical protein